MAELHGVGVTRPAGLIYAVDERPPPVILVISAVQHVAVMAITLIFPLILAREAHLSGTDFLDLVSLSMLGLGVATICFCLRSRFIGSGYLCPAAYTAIYLGPSLFALRQGGLPLVFGMTIVAGLLQIAVAPLLQRLRALLPSEIAGLVVAILGFALASIGVRYSLGISNGEAIKPTYVIIASLSLITMVVFNIWSKGYGKMFCVLIGIFIGYVTSAAFGILDLSTEFSKENLYIIRIPWPNHFAFRFDFFLFIPFLVASLAATLRVMGDVSNAQRLNDSDWVRPNLSSIAGGVFANGVAGVFCGLVGSFGINSYSSCIGLSGATAVTSRSIGFAIGIGFTALALVPAASVLFAAMPPPVMGAALFFTAAFVLTSGLQMITARMLDARKTVVIGFSFAMAMMADVYHETLTGVPLVLQPIFGNSLVLGTICAVILNLILRIGVRQRVSIKLAPGHLSREAVEQFLAEQGGQWAARRDIIDRATFSVVQLLEILGDPPSGVEIEASFDEFNLDLRVRYIGDSLILPERRPTPREVIATEDGERLLAGYLLRRSTDRIASRSTGRSIEVALHYVH